MLRRGFLSCLLALSGCASQTVVQGVPPAASSENPSFEVSGRIAVRYNGQVDSGNFSWQHTSLADRVTLETPLGQTLAELVRDAAGVRLEMSDGRQFNAATVEPLTQEVLGWALPLSGLQYWIRGVPAPAVGQSGGAPRGDPGIYQLQQQGWLIDYPEFAGPPAVPGRVVMKRPGLEIRLAMHQWKFVP